MLSADDAVHAVAYDAATTHVAFAAEGSASGNDFVVKFSAPAGRVYQLEESPDLSTTSWTTAAGDIAGNGGWIQIPLIDALGSLKRFYRVRVLP